MTIIITFACTRQPCIIITLHWKQRGRGVTGITTLLFSTISLSLHSPHGSSACDQPPLSSTGNEGVICLKNDHIKSPRHENFLSWQPPPVTSCRTIRPTQWAYSKNT